MMESKEKNLTSQNLIQFLERSISGEISLEEQVDFLAKNDELSASDMAEVVKFLQKKMDSKVDLPGAIDICGTGGSGLPRINTSTISAFILSSLGVGVAKHGNKAASGRFGSFDLLEELGLSLEITTEEIEDKYREEYLAFLYARNFHPVMKHFVEARKKYGKPTFFNILGPLLSPANVKKQIIGTAFKEKMKIIAEVCKLIGKQRVLIVSGEDGLDEVTLTGKTYVVQLEEGEISEYEINPEDFGVERCDFEEICSKDGDEKNEFNIKIAKEILRGQCVSRHADLVLVNCSIALYLDGRVDNLKDGFLMAKEVVESGEGMIKLKKFCRILDKNSVPSVLKKIVDNKRQEVDKRIDKNPLEVLKKEIVASTRQLSTSLKKPGVSLIAEIKKASPSESEILRGSFDVEKFGKEYELAGADAISVLCDEKFFGGKLDYMKKVSESTRNVPILCKDFIIDEYQIYEARSFRADAVLLIAAVLSVEEMKKFLEICKKLAMDAICEVHNEEELKKVLEVGGEIIGINNRNLHNFKIDLETTTRLLDKIPQNKIVVSESGIFSHDDVQKLPERVDAILVGTAIMKSEDRLGKILELKGRKCLLKTCGIRSVDDAKFCDEQGVDFIGLNFVPRSKRKIEIDLAKKICDSIKYSRTVGVFENQKLEVVNNIAEELELDFIQLSGDEDEEFIKKCSKPVIKGIKLEDSDK